MIKGYNQVNGIPVGLPSILSLGLPPLINPYPALNLDFTTSGPLDSRITFTRATTATRFNSAGVLETVASGTARSNDFQDYNPVTLQPRGFLIEEQRTNLLLQSGWAGATSGTPGAAPTSWTVGFGTDTVTTVLTSSFDPTANAVKFDCDSGERVMFQQAINVTNGVQYAVSAYLEAVSGSIGDGLFAVAGTATLTQNTFVTNPSAPGRYTILFTATGTGTVTVRVGVGTSTAVSSTCSATWSHPQCEAGAFATSYIPTTTTALTRNADAASMTGTNFSDWYNASEGTVYVENAVVGLRPSSTSFITRLGNTSVSGNTMNIRFGSVISGSDFFVNSSGSTQVDTTSFSITANVFYKQAYAYKVNDFAFTQNAATPLTATTAILPVGINSFVFAGNEHSGYIRKIAYYPVRLASSQLQALTS